MKNETKNNNKVNGLHVIMPANQKGGASKSTTIAEIAAALKSLDQTCLIVNLEVTKENADTANTRLRTMLRGSKIMDLDCSNPSTVIERFGEILDVAEKNHAIILLDIPGAMMTAGNAIWENLVSSDYFQDLDTFTLVGTVSNESDHFSTAVHITNLVDHEGKLVLYRGWNNPAHNIKLENMPEWKAISKSYPAIIMDTRHDIVEDLMFGRGKFKSVPGLVKLREWYETEGVNLARSERKPAELLLGSIDKMADFLSEHYLPKL